MTKIILLMTATILLIGCNNLESNARDVAASLNGVLTTAQSQRAEACQLNPTDAPCVLIKRGVAGQNALITATEAYCGWATTSAPLDPTTKCVPVKGAEAALKTAIANANELTLEIKQVVHP